MRLYGPWAGWDFVPWWVDLQHPAWRLCSNRPQRMVLDELLCTVGPCKLFCSGLVWIGGETKAGNVYYTRTRTDQIITKSELAPHSILCRRGELRTVKQATNILRQTPILQPLTAAAAAPPVNLCLRCSCAVAVRHGFRMMCWSPNGAPALSDTRKKRTSKRRPNPRFTPTSHIFPHGPCNMEPCGSFGQA